MGNIFSEENLKIELYNWSSDKFPKEQALIYTSPTDNKPVSVVRLSVNREKVLLRVADTLCADKPLRLHTEVTADENDDKTFKFGSVKVITDRRSYFEKIQVLESAIFTGSCSQFCLQSRRGNILFNPRNKMIWEAFHVYKVSIIDLFLYNVNIECDAVTGLSAKLRGPFKFQIPLMIRESLLERSVSQIQRQVNGEPPKDVIEIAEVALKGHQYVIFQSRSEASANGLRTFAANCYAQLFGGNGAKNHQCNVNNDGQFRGSGSGSTYKHCSIVMHHNEAPTKM